MLRKSDVKKCDKLQHVISPAQDVKNKTQMVPKENLVLTRSVLR